jgi:hypothetical protein
VAAWKSAVGGHICGPGEPTPLSPSWRDRARRNSRWDTPMYVFAVHAVLTLMPAEMERTAHLLVARTHATGLVQAHRRFHGPV